LGELNRCPRSTVILPTASLAGIFRRPAQPELKSSACHVVLRITISDDTWWRRPAKLSFCQPSLPMFRAVQPPACGRARLTLQVLFLAPRLKGQVIYDPEPEPFR
jgi:hypothetical protein